VVIYRYLCRVADCEPLEHRAEALRAEAVGYLVLARELRRQPRSPAADVQPPRYEGPGQRLVGIPEARAGRCAP